MRTACLLALGTLMAGAGAVHAQGSALQAGVTAGAVLSNFSGDVVEGSDFRTSPFAGVSLVFHAPSSIFGFETGVLYVPKGATEDLNEVDFGINLTYVEVPLLLRIAPTLANSTLRPVLLVGGSVAVNTGCELEISAEGQEFKQDCEAEFEALAPNDIDLGVSAGLGVDVPVGSRMTLTPAARYTLGLIEARDDEEDVKNTAIQVGVTLRIAL